ncbi:Kae1-associated kinase Bud32 [Candidatus Pacearchaeota archaeon CG10_big_fil_rev_8_21_14_0_10_31_24]|nr:MAG: Kae1-associated kinase Bud32 [Candidatus Pacearchaeota archaeon CG10_big_fil_rev_8_21_14_0_10_31_24]
MKLISQGAEAKIYLNEKKKTILKDRISKSYRLPILDLKLRKQRTKKESKILQKISSSIPVPKITKTEENKIEMEFISGERLSRIFNNLKKEDIRKISFQIGQNLAKIHNEEIIHGDLTTSNMILSKDKNLHFIDFGLSFTSNKIEDKATDIHLVKEALEAKHPLIWEFAFSKLLKGYKIAKNRKEILNRLKKVELRGRYKQSY